MGKIMPSTSDPTLGMNDEEKDGDNTKYVDELLSKELLQLSVGDRNDIQEEIHGVGCLAPEETPEFVERSLKELTLELEELMFSLPKFQTRGYQQSQLQPNTYVNEKEFRLRFLRCELFDIRKTAFRICEFLEWALILFGEYALQRPITLHDFSKDELKYFRQGYYQLLPSRDRSGRRIVVIIPGEGMEKIPKDAKAKIAMYTSWAAGCNDIDTQRKGLVFLVWFDKSIKTSQIGTKQKAKDHEVASVRASAIHCCTPDTALFRFRRSIMAMRIAHHNRYKLKYHLGDAMENRYMLQTYGIPSDQIPLTWSGTVKLNYHRQWVRLRHAIEQRELRQRLSGMDSSMFVQLNKNTMIDCPNLSDVLFRQGTSTTSHPGNVAFRVMIERRLKKLERIQRLEAETKEMTRIRSKDGSKRSSSVKIPQVKTRKVVMDVIEEVQNRRNERILFWNDLGWWDEATDHHQIYLKVEYIVREYRSTLKRKKNSDLDDHCAEEKRCDLESLSRGDNSACKRPDKIFSDPPCDVEQENRAAPTPATAPVIHLKSATSMFMEAQNGALLGDATSRKRLRLQSPFDSESDNEMDIATCFGMKFIQC
ncbi:unnamed protein product [Pseudo-nitzschia multistriata]|uniref:CRAL-TRIO domain-containing protein n=1 Tax=Pseudo-nitzschia multistriata TaxID=183589 RepID=A0A448YX81_9STRA|nr:unnamed protein product [Pseudo-nitzschia multistriata]